MKDWLNDACVLVGWQVSTFLEGFQLLSPPKWVIPGSPDGQPSVEINGAMDDDSTKSLRMEYG